MSWSEEMMARAQATIRENDLGDRTGFVDILREVAWAMILRLTPIDYGNVHSCYDNQGNIAHAGVDLTEADEAGDLWMSYQTAQNGYAIDLEQRPPGWFSSCKMERQAMALRGTYPSTASARYSTPTKASSLQRRLACCAEHSLPISWPPSLQLYGNPSKAEGSFRYCLLFLFKVSK